MKALVDREQRRIISFSIDNELVIKGDNASIGNLENNDLRKEALKSILKGVPEEDKTSYNFGRHLSYTERQNLDFPKIFVKLGGKNWKGGEIAKTLTKYGNTLAMRVNAISSRCLEGNEHLVPRRQVQTSCGGGEQKEQIH